MQATSRIVSIDNITIIKDPERVTCTGTPGNRRTGVATTWDCTVWIDEKSGKSYPVNGIKDIAFIPRGDEECPKNIFGMSLGEEMGSPRVTAVFNPGARCKAGPNTLVCDT
jgi:hypothetical protein